MANEQLASNLGYQVDKHGNCFSPKGKKVGYLCTTKDYYCVKVTVTGRLQCHVPIHRLQAYQKFGESIFEDGIHVRHLNGIPTDNSWNNIAIGSASDNMMDKTPEVRQSAALAGSRVRRKLTWEEMEQLRQEHKDGDSYRVLCSRYNLAKSTVSYIINNITYNIE